MCGEKQSLKKVHGKGIGKECRLLAQSLNEQRLTQANFNFQESDFENPDEFVKETCTSLVEDAVSTVSSQKRKWSEVMSPEPENVANITVTKVSKWAEFVTDGSPDKKDETALGSDGPKPDNIFEDGNLGDVSFVL